MCIGHVAPDPDCLGAMLAICRSLRACGRQWTASLPPGSVSARNSFLTAMAEVEPARAEDFAQADGFLVVDTARRSRCNLIAEVAGTWPAGRPVVCVDHHISNKGFGDQNWIVGDAASSCELVYALILAMSAPLDAQTANLLYAGIMTDTAGFSLPSTGSFSLRAAADLVERGADVGLLGMRLNRARSMNDFRLTRTVYDNTRTTADGLVAYSAVGYEDIRASGCGPEDIDEQVKIPRSLAGVRIAILLTEAVQNETRINFRGENGTNVLALAEQFGGGGHEQAAGARLRCNVNEALARILPAAEAAARRLA